MAVLMSDTSMFRADHGVSVENLDFDVNPEPVGTGLFLKFAFR